MTYPQSSTGFQNFVNQQLPLGAPGDFAGANPKTSVQAPANGFCAPAEGINVGVFGWGDPATGLASNYYKPNAGLGFIGRNMQALITQFLGVASTLIPAGMRVTLFNQGDFWALFSGGATVGQKVYADPVTGACTAGATGGGVAANSTAASLATTGVLTVGATLTGTLAVGQGVYAAGIPEGSYIASQISGSAGSTGTYQLANLNGTAFPVVASTTVYFAGITETPFYCASNVAVDASVTGSIATTGIMTVTAVGSGLIFPGQFITSTVAGVPVNAQVIQQLTYTTPSLANGGGGTGTYLLNLAPTAAVASGTITSTQGKLGKISSWGA